MRISLGAVKPRNRWLRIRPQIALHFLPLLFVKFPFHGFIQIGIGIGIAIGIDCLTTGHFLWFQGFWFQGFMVSRFHPNRDRGRDRYRDRSLNHAHGMALLGFLSTDLHRLHRLFWGIARVFLERQGKFLIFMKFHGFQGFIQIAIGIGIAIGIDYLTTNSRDGTARVFIHRFTQSTQIFWGIARVFLERQGKFLIFMMFYVFHGFIQIGIAIGIGIGIDYYKLWPGE
ncbi:MAG TPA: hypothetical protein PLH01_04520 [Kiritimatiellia bacterium]|nr:hypothetical protein [Kiritimatiellia bacterium]